MSRWLLLFLLVPLVVALLGMAVARYVRARNWDQPLNLGDLWLRLVSTSVTPRQALYFAFVLVPFVFLISSELLPSYVVYAVAAVYVIVKAAAVQRPVAERSAVIADQLQATIDGLEQTRGHIEFLSQLVKTKQLELESKEAEKRELEELISKRVAESAAYKNLTEEQRSLLASAVRRSQRHGVFGTAGIILGSIALNIVATVIWTLFGNPGKDDLIRQVLGLLSK